MVKTELEVDLGKKVRQAIDRIVDGGYEKQDVFDEFCNEIDPWAEIKGYTAYIRVFWYDDYDPEEMLDDVLDITNRFNIEAYWNQPSREYDACFTVMLYKEIRDE